MSQPLACGDASAYHQHCYAVCACLLAQHAQGIYQRLLLSQSASKAQLAEWPCDLQEPQIFKLILGFTLGLLVTPVVVLLALAAKGRQYTDSVAAQNSQHVRLTKEAETLTTVV